MLHVSPQRGRVTVVSLPRDSYVTIPAHRSVTDGTQVRQRRGKLNSAYSWGGPPLTVATVERTTGVRIDHYLEVDFLGFERLVDAVGGVDVCAPHRLRDRLAGLRLPKGVTHVDGQTGLAYVRARHLDARADLGRIDRQQRFLGSMAARVTSRDVLLDPRTLVRFLNAALDAVRADPGLTEKELVALGTELRHASGKDVRFRTVPIANPSYRVRGAGAVALWDDAAASTHVHRDARGHLRAHARTSRTGASTLTIPPDQISVQVYNGSTTVGRGTLASEELSGRGFAIAGPAQNWRTRSVGTDDPALRLALFREHPDAGRRSARRPARGGSRAGPHACRSSPARSTTARTRSRSLRLRLRVPPVSAPQRLRTAAPPTRIPAPRALVVANGDAEVIGEQRSKVEQLRRADDRSPQVVEPAQAPAGSPRSGRPAPAWRSGR